MAPPRYVAWLAAFAIIVAGLVVINTMALPRLPQKVPLDVNRCIVMEKPKPSGCVAPMTEEEALQLTLKIRPVSDFVLMCDVSHPATAHVLVEHNPLKHIEASAWVITTLSTEARAIYRRTIDESFTKLLFACIVIALLMLVLYKCWAPKDESSSPHPDEVALDEIETAKQTIVT